MFCPKCKGEFVEGITRCSKCNALLVETLDTDEIEYQELVDVFGPSDESLLMIAKSLLEENGINYYVKGEYLQELMGFGKISTGFNPLFGPEIIQVREEDAEKAKEVLEDLLKN
jgi:hypothetical protein